MTTLLERIEIALNISEGFKGQVDGKQLADLLLHLSEAQAGLKNSRLGDVSKPRFAEWMESNGYWQDEQFAWKSRNKFLTVDDLLSLKKEHKNL